MKNAEIKLHLQKIKQERDKVLTAWEERDKVLTAWEYIEELNKETAFSMDCFRELQARISIKLAFIDKSIQDKVNVIKSVCDVCGSDDVIEAPHMGKNCNRCHPL